jgi:hypothetical protein
LTVSYLFINIFDPFDDIYANYINYLYHSINRPIKNGNTIFDKILFLLVLPVDPVKYGMMTMIKGINEENTCGRAKQALNILLNHR